MMGHIEYTDVISEIASEGWGRESMDIEIVKNEMLDDPQKLGAWATMALLKKFDDILGCIATIQGEEYRARKLRQFVDSKMSWVKQREKKHGPIPDSVMTWLDGQQPTYTKYYCSCHFSEMPEKGTDAHAEYKRWMRRRKRKTRKG